MFHSGASAAACLAGLLLQALGPSPVDAQLDPLVICCNSDNCEDVAPLNSVGPYAAIVCYERTLSRCQLPFYKPADGTGSCERNPSPGVLCCRDKECQGTLLPYSDCIIGESCNSYPWFSPDNDPTQCQRLPGVACCGYSDCTSCRLSRSMNFNCPSFSPFEVLEDNTCVGTGNEFYGECCRDDQCTEDCRSGSSFACVLAGRREPDQVFYFRYDNGGTAECAANNEFARQYSDPGTIYGNARPTPPLPLPDPPTDAPSPAPTPAAASACCYDDGCTDCTVGGFCRDIGAPYEVSQDETTCVGTGEVLHGDCCFDDQCAGDCFAVGTDRLYCREEARFECVRRLPFLECLSAGYFRYYNAAGECVNALAAQRRSEEGRVYGGVAPTEPPAPAPTEPPAPAPITPTESPTAIPLITCCNNDKCDETNAGGNCFVLEGGTTGGCLLDKLPFELLPDGTCVGTGAELPGECCRDEECTEGCAPYVTSFFCKERARYECIDAGNSLEYCLENETQYYRYYEGAGTDDCVANNGFTMLYSEPGRVYGDSQMSGDPHIKTWTGKWFDYHGECDLVYVHVPDFEPETPLSIHVRTTGRYDYSYIEAAVIQIGQDTLEVGSFGNYAVNGIDSVNLNPVDFAGLATLDSVDLAGFAINHTVVNDKQHIFDVLIGSSGRDEKVTLSTWKDLVTVKIHGATDEHFGTSTGLIGTFHGKMLARNGTDMASVLLGDANVFGQEWQVHGEEEPMLFRDVRAPQHPGAKCILPGASAKTTGRRLGSTTVSQVDAENACSRFFDNGPEKEACIFDVVAVGDLDMAGAV